MEYRKNLLKYVRIFSGTFCIIGTILFCIGFFGMDSGAMTAVGIGMVMGSVFLFLIGVFLVIVDELSERTN